MASSAHLVRPVERQATQVVPAQPLLAPATAPGVLPGGTLRILRHVRAARLHARPARAPEQARARLPVAAGALPLCPGEQRYIIALKSGILSFISIKFT